MPVGIRRVGIRRGGGSVRLAGPAPAIAAIAGIAAIAVVAAGCAGNGDGLDQNGQPLGSSGGAPPPLTADFASIQDNVFTPICTRCHIGASAPEGLQLDAAHSYGLLVGVPSVEQPNVLRVEPGNPDASYLIRKLEGASGISGGQMPLGGPYLPQATIDMIRQWITEGAQKPQSVAHRQTQPDGRMVLEVIATSPTDAAVVAAPVREIVIAFSADVEAALVNSTTIRLEPVTGTEFLTATAPALPATLSIAAGNPATIVIHPLTPLGPGKYRVTVRGTGGGGELASVTGATMDADYDFVFTVESPR